ncbi:allophanate hydrolase [Psychromonas marina]|uniref:Allophanate hydrolase n=1 Tax=Psychromonas marina TaxID=88364 RepID=A0ABQ6DWD1_9GAMM|nr:biotin-dependent carboxyltransferase family protein [Psychromonas marina]GLS89319.1 allophanate hydrolase [Psychromonas marina]
MNNKTGLVVKKAGLFTQLQDRGRFNQAQQGLSQGGLCDELAAGWANYLLGNSSNAALLEISFGQAEFEACCDMMLSLTGAPMNASVKRLSGKVIKQKNNCSFSLKHGESLILSYATSGVRAYLAVLGGFAVEPVLGSVSTVKRNLMGGLHKEGCALQDGEFLPILSAQRLAVVQQMPQQFIPDYSQTITLSVIESYQSEQFLVSEKSTFYSTEYAIDKHSDRMGMRLQGEAIKGHLQGIVSEGIALGSVQIPADGQPIILLQDRQTLGGYPKLGCVARCDLSRLAQQSIGTKVRFKRGDLAVERLRYLQRLRFFNR